MPNMALSILGVLLLIPSCRSLSLSVTLTGFAEPTIVTYFAVTSLESNNIRPRATFTSLREITPTLENPVAIETISSSTILGTYPQTKYEVDYVRIILEPGQGEEINEDYSTQTSRTEYYLPFTFTRPSICTTDDPVLTTSTSFSLPTVIDSVITPISTGEPTTTVYNGPEPITYTIYTAYLDQKIFPTSVVDNARDTLYPPDYTWCKSKYYNGDGDFSMCYAYELGGYGNYQGYGGGYICSNGQFHTWGLTTMNLILIMVFSWFGCFLILGLVESWRRFGRLMNGHRAKRGIPAFWGCLVPIVTIPLFWLSRKEFPERPEEDREDLEKKWANLSPWEKFMLWLRYGFTFEYPPMLGPPPIELVPMDSPQIQEEMQNEPPPPYRPSTPSQTSLAASTPGPVNNNPSALPPRYESD